MQLSLTSPVAARRPFVARAAARRCTPGRLAVRAGLFDFLGGGGAKPAKGKAAELVEELLTASRRAGANPRPAVREEIAELAGKLRQFRTRAPTRSPLFWGEYDVVFTANPNATGGPVLTSGLGKLFAAGQQPRQALLQEEGLLVNTVEFRTLGVLPGKVRQEGQLTVLDGNRYEVELERGRGGPVTRRFEVLYLDERVRVVQFLPEDGRDPSLFVFVRVADEAEAEAEEEEYEDEDGEEQAPKPTWLPLGGTQRVKAGQQPAAAAAEPDEAGEAAAQPPKPRFGFGGTRRVKAQPAAEPAAAEEGGEQLEQLVAAASRSQEERKSVAAQLKELEKEAAGTARSAAPARAAFERAQAEAEQLEQQLAAAVQAAQAANDRYQQAASQLRDAERAAR